MSPEAFLIEAIDNLNALIAAQPEPAPSNVDLFTLNPEFGPAMQRFRGLSQVEQLAFLRVMALQCRASQIESEQPAATAS